LLLRESHSTEVTICIAVVEEHCVIVGVTVLLSSTLFTDYRAQCAAVRRCSAVARVTALGLFG
jgi:hypothetical protein